MAQGFASEVIGSLDGTLTPAAKTDGRVVNAPLRRFRATLDLSLSTTKLASGDTNVLCRLPAGFAFAFGILTVSATLGSTTASIGPSTSAAKYRAAAVATAVNTPEVFGKAASIDDDPLTAYEDVLITWGAATAPSSGIVTADIFASGR